jgi:predicted HNH restriction endonuclease
MANYNMSFTKKMVNQLGLTVQLIPSNNPLTCSKIIAGTQVFKVANKTNAEIEAILTALSEGCKTISSDLRADNNTGNIEKFINLNQSLNSALVEYTNHVLNSNDTVSAWHDMLINFYCYDDEGHEIDGLDKVSDVMNTLLDTKQVAIYKNHRFTIDGAIELIKKWHKFNKLDSDDCKNHAIAQKYIDLLARV